MWRLPCSDKDPPIEEKGEELRMKGTKNVAKDEELRMRGNEECGAYAAYRAVTKILQ